MTWAISAPADARRLVGRAQQLRLARDGHLVRRHHDGVRAGGAAHRAQVHDPAPPAPARSGRRDGVGGRGQARLVDLVAVGVVGALAAQSRTAAPNSRPPLVCSMRPSSRRRPRLSRSSTYTSAKSPPRRRARAMVACESPCRRARRPSFAALEGPAQTAAAAPAGRRRRVVGGAASRPAIAVRGRAARGAGRPRGACGARTPQRREAAPTARQMTTAMAARLTTALLGVGVAQAGAQIEEQEPDGRLRPGDRDDPAAARRATHAHGAVPLRGPTDCVERQPAAAARRAAAAAAHSGRSGAGRAVGGPDGPPPSDSRQGRHGDGPACRRRSSGVVDGLVHAQRPLHRRVDATVSRPTAEAAPLTVPARTCTAARSALRRNSCDGLRTRCAAARARRSRPR